MPLQPIGDGICYLAGLTHAGVIVGVGGQAILIDTGSGDRSGRKILRALAEAGLRPVAILNTHAHGDHTGGNACIVEQAGARIYAPALESALLEQPSWAAISFFMGAEPPPELQVARYAPRPCQVDVLVEEGTYAVAGRAIQAVPLAGHTPAHTGYLVDGILFTGDALAGPRELAAAPISFLYSVTCQLATLEYLRTLRCQGYVLAHDGPVTDIAPLVAANLERIQQVIDLLLDLLAPGPQEAAGLLADLCGRLALEPRHLRDHLLLNATLHAYLGHLRRSGLVSYELAGRRLRWRIAPG